MNLDGQTGTIVGDFTKRGLVALAVGNQQEEGYRELLANIRRLTILVLDELEEGSRERTLDQVQKRLLSSTGARLLRLWRVVLREGGSEKVSDDLSRISNLLPNADKSKHEGVREVVAEETTTG